MVRRSVEDIKNDYNLHTAVYHQSKQAYKEAEIKHEQKQSKFYTAYFILFAMSSVAVWFSTHSIETLIGYIFMGFFVSVTLTSHIFVSIFTDRSTPQAADYNCSRTEREKYVNDIKHEIVESMIQGHIMKIDFKKSSYSTWNMIVTLDEDNKSHEYYAEFFFDDEKSTIDVNVHEFVAKNN